MKLRLNLLPAPERPVEKLPEDGGGSSQAEPRQHADQDDERAVRLRRMEREFRRIEDLERDSLILDLHFLLDPSVLELLEEVAVDPGRYVDVPNDLPVFLFGLGDRHGLPAVLPDPGVQRRLPRLGGGKIGFDCREARLELLVDWVRRRRSDSPRGRGLAALGHRPLRGLDLRLEPRHVGMLLRVPEKGLGKHRLELADAHSRRRRVRGGQDHRLLHLDLLLELGPLLGELPHLELDSLELRLRLLKPRQVRILSARHFLHVLGLEELEPLLGLLELAAEVLELLLDEVVRDARFPSPDREGGLDEVRRDRPREDICLLRRVARDPDLE